jgi:3-hydroxyacyl-[acyl-carrier-protein] dehydratase
MSRWREEEALRLGPDVVQRLIPHRRPLLMVDGVDAFRRAPAPTLWARRHISANEEVFAGHFPGFSIWPGIYTIEGLGQTSLVLTVLLHLIGAAEAQGKSAAEVLDALRQLEQRRSLRPGAPRTSRTSGASGASGADGSPAFQLDDLAGPEPPAGLSGQIDMKLLAPVFAGQELRYRVSLTHTLDSFARFEVEAEVAGTAVARGHMTGLILKSP